MRAYAVPVSLLATALATVAVLALLPDAPALAGLFMELGLATIAGGTGFSAALSFWSVNRSGHTFPRSPLPPVLARLCPTCGGLEAPKKGTQCESCGAPLEPLGWHRDTPQPLLAFLIALVATGAGLFVVGALGSGRHGFAAFTSHFVLGASVATTAVITALAWVFFGHVAHASRRGTVHYVTGRASETHEHRALARVAHDGTIASAAGTSRVLSAKRFVPPFSLASSEGAREALRALRKLAAHDKIALRISRRIAWRRTAQAEAITHDYRNTTEQDLHTEETEEAYVLAPRQEDGGSESWSRSIGLAAAGSSPLGAYLGWIEQEPAAHQRLIEAAAAIEAEEEASEEVGALASRRANRR